MATDDATPDEPPSAEGATPSHGPAADGLDQAVGGAAVGGPDADSPEGGGADPSGPAGDEAGNPRWGVIGAAAAAALVAVLVLTVVIVRTRNEDAQAAPVEVVPTTTPPTVAETTPPDTEPATTTTEPPPPPTEPPTTTGPRPTRTVPVPTTPPKPMPDRSIGAPYPSTVAQGAVPNVEVFDSPGGRAKFVLANPKLINGDPNARVPLVMLVKQQAGSWIEVWTPVRPNGSTGWVRDSDVTLSQHDYFIEVHLRSFTLRAWQGDNLIMDTKVAVAAANSPTPGGLYYTTELLAPPGGGGGPYGPRAYGLSGFSDTYQTFGGGPGQLGLHGTNEPGSIGRAVSHGCIRLNNGDIQRLADTLPLGVPIAIYA